ncbi:MAG: nuclear transport factor 2 family protein [Anaerolineae bacterium]|nr:nuclear transport factor 2 family protein [Anaerolineae bacterium]
MARSTKEVFDHHVDALMRGDLTALMTDYADDGVLMTMDAVYTGKEAIRSFFVEALGSLPNLRLTGTGEHVSGDVVMCTYCGDCDVATVPAGVDTFIIRDDKIRLQTGWFTVVPK